MSDNFQTGIDGKTTINGNEVALISWSVAPSADIQEFINSKTGRYPQNKATFKRCTFTIVVEHDHDTSIFEAPINVDTGEEILQTKLFLAGLTSDHWHFPSGIVEGTPQALEVGGKIQTTINARANGQWGRPGSPVA